tara:strand:- start:597 stop:911 length:315 start_codon:yes stop_codon:yes gene_type:complete
MSRQELIQTLYSDADERTKLQAYWGRHNLLPCPQQFSIKFYRRSWCNVGEEYRNVLQIYDWKNGHPYGLLYTMFYAGKKTLTHGFVWRNKFDGNARYSLKFKEE